MNITIITTKPPSLKSGSEVRNYYLLKSLLDSSNISHVQLVYVNYDARESDIQIRSEKLAVSVFPLPKRSITKSVWAYASGEAPYIQHLIDNPFSFEIEKKIAESDLTVISELDGYFVASQSLEKSKKPFIFDCHNVDHLRFNSDISLSPFPKNLLGKWLSPGIKRNELAALKRSHLVICCSEKDKDIFSSFVNEQKVHVVPNGAVAEKLAPRKVSQTPSVLFLGLLSYIPNEEGIKFYINEVHPKVLVECPEAELVVIGKNPPSWLVDLAKQDKQIQVLGFVENLRGYLGEATVCICPLKSGSGTRLKVLEYMAAGKSVVSTSIGAEGIDVTDGKNIFIQDDPNSFATSVVRLIQDKKLSRDIGDEAFQLVSHKYNWKTIGENFVELVKSVQV